MNQPSQLLDGQAYYDQEFLSAKEASELYRWCDQNLPWEQRQGKLYGKAYQQPRLVCYMSNQDYTYSGLEYKAKPIPDQLQAIIQRFHHDTGYTVNAVLANKYRNGHDYVSMHADDEKSIIPDSPIYSLSLGATREFVLAHNSGLEKLTLHLTHGSLLVMGKDVQRNYKHGIPKRLRVKEPRINLTFRCMKE